MVSGGFNNDCNIDLIVSTFGDNTIELYSNDGSGNFSLFSLLPNTLGGITGIKFIDLNGDTFEDIVVCSYNNDKVVWFANDCGGGNFSIAGEK
ncbi:VCBS repeat-containing protein [Flavobacteriaceae bacterium S0862]|nr:VCBS repeat-containing protein [Flavobacteriaceae bacterium S0862]